MDDYRDNPTPAGQTEPLLSPRSDGSGGEPEVSTGGATVHNTRSYGSTGNTLTPEDETRVNVHDDTTAVAAQDCIASFGPTIESYFYGSVATVIKTVAWWFNQWPPIQNWNFFGKWAASAAIAGCEYAPLTMAMQTANKKRVHLGLMTAYMEFADNLFRMLQQLFLGDSLSWSDWTAAGGLGVCVAWQGYMHYKADRKQFHLERVATALHKDPPPLPPTEQGGLVRMMSADPKAPPVASPTAGESQTKDEKPNLKRITTLDGREMDWNNPKDVEKLTRHQREVKILAALLFVLLVVGSLCGSLLAGAYGQAYTLATVATAAKTFAWWINQYPQLRGLSFFKKWMAGWSIAALIEYLPLMGAFTIASDNSVHLGLMTAYMEALDNFFRICQQKFLGKPLAWYDLWAAAGMFFCVIFQGIMKYLQDHGEVRG